MHTHTITRDRRSGPYAEKRDARGRLVCHDCELVIRRDMGRFVYRTDHARVVCGWCLARAIADAAA